MSPLKWASVPARFSVSRIRGSTLRASPSVQPRHRPLPAVSDAWPAPCVSVYAIPLVLRTRRLPRHLRGRFNGFRVNLRSEEHTSELQSRLHLVCRLLLEKKKTKSNTILTLHVSKP